MAKKTKNDTDEKSGGGKKKLLIPVVVVALGLFGAKTMLLKESPKTAAQLEADKKEAALALYNECAEANHLPSATEVAEGDKDAAGRSQPARMRLASTFVAAPKVAEGAAPAPAVEGMGPILSLDSVTVNLVDGHYLKLGLALQLDVEGDVVAAKDQGLGAKALDMALSTLQRHTMKELIAPSKRTEIKQALGFRTCRAYQGAVTTVYFTEFVLQ